MIKPGYKRLGDYIEPLDERNTNLSVKLSQGICNNKYFITPRQVAENSANDKIVRTGQFAYNRATTRNGDKISIAYREGPDCSVSSAYQIFRIKDENKLNPHYLWMWFRRPEFDRYARFKSRGSAHEFFEWDEMCEVYLPIPDIDEQRRIVAKYHTVEDRIHNNEVLLNILEYTTQSYLKELFKVGSRDNGLSILSDGWRLGKMKDIAYVNPSRPMKKGQVSPCFDMATLPTQGAYPLYSEKKPYNGGMRFKNGDTIFARITPCLENGKCAYINFLEEGEVAFGSTEYIVLAPKHKCISPELFYFLTRSQAFVSYAIKNMTGTSGRQRVSGDSIEEFGITIPTDDVLLKASSFSKVIMNYMTCLSKENRELEKVKSLLLTRL